MNKFISTAILLALTGITQVASSQVAGQFDQNNTDRTLQEHVRPDPRDPRDPRYPRDPRDPRDPRERLQWYSAGEARTRKIVNNEFTFRPRLHQRVDRLRLVGTQNGVIIRSVIVEFRNGGSMDLRRLEGRLREGERLAVNIGGRRITEIRVVATSESLTGSRGRFRVDLGVFQ